MAHIMTKRGNLDNIITYQHICDTTADLSNISQEYRTLGSIAIVIEGEGGGLEIYITNSNKQWIPLTVSSSAGEEGITLAEVNELIANALGDITGFSTQIVNTLPESNINTGTIYLIANNNNGYDEYIYVNNNWQKIGSTNISQLQNIQDGHGQGSIEEGVLSGNSAVSATGTNSHAEGIKTAASGNNSHAEGFNTRATGNGSHAEGSSTIASGYSAHAEGDTTYAAGDYSHAEGSETQATGYCSHTEGQYTIANHASQYVFGQFNITDDNISSSNNRGTYIEIVGNGNSILRSNARTLDWNGNQTLAGTLTTSSNGITIGNTTLTEAQLQALLALLE